MNKVYKKWSADKSKALLEIRRYNKNTKRQEILNVFVDKNNVNKATKKLKDHDWVITKQKTYKIKTNLN